MRPGSGPSGPPRITIGHVVMGHQTRRANCGRMEGYTRAVDRADHGWSRERMSTHQAFYDELSPRSSTRPSLDAGSRTLKVASSATTPRSACVRSARSSCPRPGRAPPAMTLMLSRSTVPESCRNRTPRRPPLRNGRGPCRADARVAPGPTANAHRPESRLSSGSGVVQEDLGERDVMLLRDELALLVVDNPFRDQFALAGNN